MAREPQNYKNHRQITPLFHYAVVGTLLVYFLWAAYRLVTAPGLDALMTLVLAVGLFLLAFSARVMALTVQNRVIRLEMRLRLHEVLPADLRARINELRTNQLVALRFASDAELPQLVRDTLDGRLASGNDIKLRIKDWQADYLRA
jgi:hypothetical protein